MAWAFVQSLAALKTRGRGAGRAVNVLIPVFFGLWILLLWEIVVRGFGIPQVLLPRPERDLGANAYQGSLPTLAVDFRQTFKAVLFGYTVGCLSGFVVAILADRVPFLRRGLCRSAISSARFRSSASRRSWSCGSASTGRRRPRSSSS